MAEGAARRAPWAKRLAIAGALFLVLGALLINSQNDAICLLYTSPSPRDRQKSRMPSSA